MPEYLTSNIKYSASKYQPTSAVLPVRQVPTFSGVQFFQQICELVLPVWQVPTAT